MKYSQIHDKKEIDLLRGKIARYKSLNFSFSDQYLQTLTTMLDEKHSFQMFAKDEDNTFAGYIASAEKAERPKFLSVVELFVDPNHQKQGIASILLEHVIKSAKNNGLEGIITQTEFENIPAQNLYEKSGF